MLRFTKRGRHWGILSTDGSWDGLNYHQITPIGAVGKTVKWLAIKRASYSTFQYW